MTEIQIVTLYRRSMDGTYQGVSVVLRWGVGGVENTVLASDVLLI